ncbi:MAG: hypothetical protein CFK48_05580 [Armatimonadetes bacterium CP1_7O]|nr:MAG: hypothetical protein CFK48_05580 [Armatimonadetes bacterium CP1_7O]
MANYICPECFGSGYVCSEVLAGYSPEFGEYVADWREYPCPLCEGTGEYDEAFLALCNMPAQELKEYAGEASHASL